MKATAVVGRTRVPVYITHHPNHYRNILTVVLDHLLNGRVVGFINRDRHITEVPIKSRMNGDFGEY